MSIKSDNINEWDIYQFTKDIFFINTKEKLLTFHPIFKFDDCEDFFRIYKIKITKEKLLEIVENSYERKNPLKRLNPLKNSNISNTKENKNENLKIKIKKENFDFNRVEKYDWKLKNNEFLKNDSKKSILLYDNSNQFLSKKHQRNLNTMSNNVNSNFSKKNNRYENRLSIENEEINEVQPIPKKLADEDNDKFIQKDLNLNEEVYVDQSLNSSKSLNRSKSSFNLQKSQKTIVTTESIDSDFVIDCDYKNNSNYLEMKLDDQRIIDKHLINLKMDPYQILLKIKNKNKDLEIKEHKYIENQFACALGIRHKYIIESAKLSIKVFGWASTLRKAKLYATQKFFMKMFKNDKNINSWGDLERIYAGKKNKNIVVV